MGHFVGQTNFNQDSTSVNGILITLLSCGARIFTNVFLIIGVWFMVDSRFGAKKILRIDSPSRCRILAITLISFKKKSLVPFIFLYRVATLIAIPASFMATTNELTV